MKTQADIVSRRRAPIMVGEEESPKSNLNSYPTHFRCKIDPEKKRKLKSWAKEKSLTQEIRRNPATIRPNNGSEFVTGISNEKASKILPTIK